MDDILVATSVHMMAPFVTHSFSMIMNHTEVQSCHNMGRQAHSRFRGSRWLRLDALFLEFLRLAGWEREGIPFNGGDERLTADGPFLLPQGELP